MSMEIISAGMMTTVQDMGRQGYAGRGFQENGACDKCALQIANLLVGNVGESGQMGRTDSFRNPGQAALELTMKGAAIRFSTQEIIALAGADMAPGINGTPVPMYCPVRTEPGDVLTMGMARQGLRSYLAVAGGFDVPLMMGSRSTSLKCGLGGYQGRALQKGDVLRSGASSREIRLFYHKIAGKEARLAEEAAAMAEQYYGEAGDGKRDSHPLKLRVVAGPQEEAFTVAGMETFMGGSYRLTADSDRMACKLDGPAIETCRGCDIISDGIVEGSIQVASDGRPIVMMADHQTTGGYAKIGTVISADIPRLAQLRPGEAVVFRLVTPQEGVEAAREMAGRIFMLKERLKRLWADCASAR